MRFISLDLHNTLREFAKETVACSKVTQLITSGDLALLCFKYWPWVSRTSALLWGAYALSGCHLVTKKAVTSLQWYCKVVLRGANFFLLFPPSLLGFLFLFF